MIRNQANFPQLLDKYIERLYMLRLLYKVRNPNIHIQQAVELMV
jgi:hypothetical protein